jgi:NAD-dependent dihydropyrimidine dehydrogenase PreA subunit
LAKFKIIASKDTVSEPVISKTIYKTGAQFYISKAKVGEWGKELVVDIIGSEDEVREAVDDLERSGAKVSRFEERVTIDRNLCVDCGACVTLCPWYAIEIKEDWEIAHIPEKCVSGCSLCVSCCPVRAIRSEEIERS